MFNLTNKNKRNSNQSNSLIKNNKKISISIYSNPYSIKFPFSKQPILNNNLNNLYKITSEKIQNNKNENKHEHKLTISNLLSMVQSNNSISHNSINKSFRNQGNLKKNNLKYFVTSKFNFHNFINEENKNKSKNKNNNNKQFNQSNQKKDKNKEKEEKNEINKKKEAKQKKNDSNEVRVNKYLDDMSSSDN